MVTAYKRKCKMCGVHKHMDSGNDIYCHECFKRLKKSKSQQLNNDTI